MCMYVWFRLLDEKEQEKNKERKEERTEGNKEKVNERKGKFILARSTHVINQISVLKVVSNHPKPIFRERQPHDIAGYQVQLR